MLPEPNTLMAGDRSHAASFYRLLEESKVLSADAGSIAISGQDVEFAFTRVLSADAGSISISGQDATLAKGFLLAADAGSIAISGQDVGFAFTRVISVDAGSISISGQDADLTATRQLSVDAGSISISGQDTTLLADRLLSADAGSISLSGQDVDLLAARLLSVENGSIAISGQDAEVLAARLLSADNGSIVISGQDVTLALGFSISVDYGSISISGQDVTLFVSGATHYFFDPRTSAMWPVAFANVELDPHSIVAFPPLGTSDASDVLFGGEDGHVRQLDRTLFQDDGFPFQSYVVLGPIATVDASLVEGLVNKLQAVLSSQSGEVDWQLRVAKSHQGAVSEAAQESGTWQSPGLNDADRPRSRGAAFSLRLANGEDNDGWSIEELNVTAVPAGKRRV